MVMSDDAGAVTRTRLEARRRAFLEAASAVFLEKGYANATLNDVIAKSGGSMQTLYSLFGGKQGLFEALIAERGASIIEPFAGENLLDRTPDDVLVALGIRYLEAVTTPDALGTYRLVVAEGIFMKELAERFWAMGPNRGLVLLTDYMEQQTQRGVLHLRDPRQAARQFWGMLLGNFHMECLLGLREPPKADEIEAAVRTAVARFLDGCRTGKV
jgi:TetR/AcrR family transcriptional repressor of mexJK operon